MAKHLVKANDDVLSHCKCAASLAAGPGQLDCPWCGCGWLISCMDCRKAFTFARVTEVDMTYRDLAARDLAARGFDADEEDVAEWAKWLEEALAPLPIGAIVVYLDGHYLPVDARDIDIEGDFAAHQFAQLPHALALDDPSQLRATLGNTGYWLERELPDRE